MTCGERRHAQPGCKRYLYLCEEPRSLRYLNQRVESGSLHYLNQREESGRLSHLDQLGESGASATSTSGSLRETRRIILRETRRSLYPGGTSVWSAGLPVFAGSRAWDIIVHRGVR